MMGSNQTPINPPTVPDLGAAAPGTVRAGRPALEGTRVDLPGPTGPMPALPPEPLRHIGPYRLLRLLGQGGMVSVFLGYDEVHHQQVALKVLADHLVQKPSAVARFYREGRTGLLLNHPNIVRSLAVGQDRATGKHFL